MTASAPIWGWRLVRTGKWRTDWRGRFGHTPHDPRRTDPASAEKSKTLLIHAVSVGEVNLIRPLVDQLARHRPELRLIIAATTNTGFDRATQLFADRHHVVRYPFDLTDCVRRFLDAVKPDVVALTELEVWPNFVEQCAHRRIPVCVINGRLSERSFGRYKFVRPWVCKTFSRLAFAAVQNEAIAARFHALGVSSERTAVYDTMKWDAADLADKAAGADELASALGVDCSRPIIVAGSTGPGEEQLLLQATPKDAQLILAPRKPERFDAVARLEPSMVRRTRPKTPASPAANSDVRPTRFLLDTLGELRCAYALADVVVVGRSFNGWGGSDPIEPIALGKAAIIGPDYHNFQDAVDALRQADGLIVSDTARLGEHLSQLLANRARAKQLAENGRSVILARQGAVQKHVDLLLNLLDQNNQ